MAQQLDNKKKYMLLVLILIFILILTLILLVVMGKTLTTNSQSNEEQNNIDQENVTIEENNMEQEDEVIKVIIDPEENQELEGNKEQPKEENPNEEGNTVDNPTLTTKDKSKYYIKINNRQNVVTVYQQDTKGEYTVPVKAMICSIGEATPTSGVYKTTDKYTWRLLQGDVYGQYAVRITGHILFHSVPYTAKSKDSLEWWEYDKLGTDASLGCIRLKVEDAKWIYDNCKKGTQVEFYYDDNPGPLGKPTAKKISSYSDELKNWDPTDPDPRNPWKTYKEPVVQPEPEENLPSEDVPVVIPPEEITPTPEQTPSENPEGTEGDVEKTESIEPIKKEEEVKTTEQREE